MRPTSLTAKALCVFILTSVALAACAGGASAPAAEPGAPQASQPAAGPKPAAQAPSGPSSAYGAESGGVAEAVVQEAPQPGQARPGVPIRPVDEPITLDVWLTDWNEQTQRLMAEDLIPTFQAENPGISVRIQYLDWRVFTEKLVAAYAGGVLPDIYQAGAEYVAPLATRGMALELDEYVEQWGERDDFYESTWNTVTWQGKTYGIPYLTAPQTLIYRQDMLQAVGIDQAPQTWEELADAAVRATQKDGERFLVSGFNARPIWHQFIYFLWQNGGDVFDPETNTVTVNSPEAVEALEYFARFFNEWGVASRSGISAPTANLGIMAADMAAMTLGNQFVIEDFRKNNPAQADQLVVAEPTMRREQVATVWTDWLAISRQTRQPDESWRLVEFFMEPENMLKYNETMFVIPPRKSLREAGFMNDPQLQRFVSIMERHGRSLTSSPAALDVYQVVLKNAVEDAVHGKKSAERALDDAARQIERLLRRAG